MSAAYDNLEVYISTNKGEIISPRFNFWAWHKEDITVGLHTFLKDIVIHIVYSLINANKFNKVKINDAYINMITDDEVIPLVSYTENFQFNIPTTDINKAIYDDYDSNGNPTNLEYANEYNSLFVRLFCNQHGTKIYRNICEFLPSDNTIQRFNCYVDIVNYLRYENAKDQPYIYFGTDFIRVAVQFFKDIDNFIGNL